MSEFKFKQVIVVRTDLKMSKGKLAAQAGHAAVTAAEKVRKINPGWWKNWMDEGQCKIVVRVGSEEELLELAEAGVGVAHCPSSNMITGAGIAPVSTMLDYGLRVGLGVDGSSANDMSNMIREARQAMLLARIKGGPETMSARQALQLATVGGAKVLHWDDELGTLEPGKCADIVLFQATGFEWAGVVDPIAGLIRCDVSKADLVMVNGQILVKNGELVHGELYKHLENHRLRTKQLNG